MSTRAAFIPSFRFSRRVAALEIALLLVALFWGTSYGMTKQALSFSSVFVFIAIRFSLTCLCLLPQVVKDSMAGRNQDWPSAIPGGVILAAIFLLEVYGVFHTSAAKAAFIISLSAIMTALLEPFINKKPIGTTLGMMALLSVVGVMCLTSASIGFESFHFNLGDGLILLAAFLRALMVTTTKRFTQHKQITTTTLTAIQSCIVASVALLGVTMSPETISLPRDIEFWLIMGYLVVFCTLFAFYVQNYAVRRLSPTRVSILMGSEPLFGAMFAMVWLGESLSILQVFGGGLIFLSVMVTTLRMSR